MDFDVTITFNAMSPEPAFGEALLERFIAVAPTCDPVVAQDLPSRETRVTFSVEADDAAAASNETVSIMRAVAGALAGDIAPTAIHVDAAQLRAA